MLFNQALGIGSALSPFEAMLNQVFGNGENGTRNESRSEHEGGEADRFRL